MRLKPGPRAGDPNAHRSRIERSAGVRGFVRSIFSRAAPRLFTSGQSLAQSSGGSGSGAGFIGSLGTTGKIINIGIPTTGQRYACWGFWCWDSTADVWGA